MLKGEKKKEKGKKKGERRGGGECGKGEKELL